MSPTRYTLGRLMLATGVIGVLSGLLTRNPQLMGIGAVVDLVTFVVVLMGV